MTTFSTVFECCQRLTQQGKTPSVALVRAHAHQPISLQEAIAGLKQWRSLPPGERQKGPSEPQPTASSDQPDLTLEQRVEQLEAQVLALQSELARIKTPAPAATDTKTQPD
ncbi:hypothetical protein HMF8227_02167 [Saliniradius amylolyticus]|uniref:KfrA N-terminal DNA-binding domain-containing protein n=1 Tax=Saliniradius amylolyticus TaxID=2183582 RepID=A0A2S2E4Q4_9ALTE|nr:hypothetical protein [Saliniradius amylolyticus]AWL12625.1 hypothetical protein HMF8227_02167 [Saliniradius amylolyticus]